MYRVSVETMSNSRPKMRIPGFAAEVFAEVSVNPTNIAPGELYTALERNTIDAVEWVGPALDLRVAMRTVSYNMLVLLQHENAKAWASIKKDFPNVQIKQFPQDIFQAMFDANKKLLMATSKRLGL